MNIRMLSEKQIMEFVNWYKSIYGDTSKETGTGELPHIKASEEEEHIRMRKEFLTKLIGPKKSKYKYIHKGGRIDTWIGKAFGDLWMCYGPIVDED